MFLCYTLTFFVTKLPCPHSLAFAIRGTIRSYASFPFIARAVVSVANVNPSCKELRHAMKYMFQIVLHNEVLLTLLPKPFKQITDNTSLYYFK